MKLRSLSRHYAVVFVLLFLPVLQGCSSLPTTLAVYGVKALMSIRHSNESAFGYYQLGKYFQQRNELDAAVTAYEKALSVDPDHLESRTALGIVSSLQRKLDVAIEHFRFAVSQAPRSAHLYNNLGHAYYLQGKYSEAIESLETAVGLDSRNHVTVHNLGLAYEGAGRHERAEEAFRKSAEIRSLYASPAASKVVAQHIGTERPSKPATASVNTSGSDLLSKAASRSAKHIHSIISDVSTARAGNHLVARDIDTSTTIILVESNVYELRAPTSAPPTPALPAPGIEQLASVDGTRVGSLEIANGNAIPGLAKSVADQLRRSGFHVVRLTNERPYRRPSTELQYRQNYAETATQLTSVLERRIIVAPTQSLRSDVHLRLVLGHDVITSSALLRPRTSQDDRDKTLVAQR